MSYFKDIAPIQFEGPDSDNEFAYCHYDPNEVVMGKRMEDHLRLAVAYWHSLAYEGGDPFGGRTFERPWYGDDMAAALGVRVGATRLAVILGAVGMIAVATATTGPIAFVAFLSGPIAARLVGAGGSLLVPAGLVGALLVLVADFAGQFAFDTRYPVGVVTGVLGAPYLVYLIVRTHRAGGSI